MRGLRQFVQLYTDSLYNVQVTFIETGISPSRPRETDRILCQIVQFSKPTEGQKVIGEDDVSGIGLVCSVYGMKSSEKIDKSSGQRENMSVLYIYFT